MAFIAWFSDMSMVHLSFYGTQSGLGAGFPYFSPALCLHFIGVKLKSVFPCAQQADRDSELEMVIVTFVIALAMRYSVLPG